MKNELGLNFFRVVNEEGDNGWGQVYARIPFDEAELKEKGALFGVVFSSDLSDWPDKEAKVMSWLDEFFNKSEGEINLSLLVGDFEKKYKEYEAVLVWLGMRGELRFAKIGSGKLWFWKKGNLSDLSKNITSGKVIKGAMLGGEKMAILVGENLGKIDDPESWEDLSTFSTEAGNELLERKLSAACLCFDFGKKELVEDEEVDNQIDFEEHKQIQNEEADDGLEVVNEVKEELEKTDTENLASEKVVGRLKWKDKMENWLGSIKGNGVRLRSTGGNKKQNVVMVAGGVLVVILVFSLLFGVVRGNQEKANKKWLTFSQPIEKMIDDANSLSKVNLVGAKKMMEQVKGDFNSGKGDFTDSKYKDRLAELEKKINTSWQSATGEKDVEFGTMVDLSLVRDGFLGERLVNIEGDNFMILDGKMGVVMGVRTKSKDAKILAGKGEGLGWRDVVNNGKSNYVLTNGDIRLMEKGEVKAQFDAAVGKAEVLGHFGNNLYVLDSANREIYKFTVSSDGTIGDRVRWLKQGQNISLGKTVDMAMDSDVWVLGEKSIEKFRKGMKESFELSGVPQDSVFARMAVVDGVDQIALLDSTNGRVLIFKKSDGSFLSQYKSEKLKNARDIEIDSEGGIWVVMESKMAKVN